MTQSDCKQAVATLWPVYPLTISSAALFSVVARQQITFVPHGSAGSSVKLPSATTGITVLGFHHFPTVVAGPPPFMVSNRADRDNAFPTIKSSILSCRAFYRRIRGRFCGRPVDDVRMAVVPHFTSVDRGCGGAG
ncbi:hypothetical protein BJY04DRAFT_8276 [Aspergillus karnatakaensis]|uniref:uncharacterized protein n=1 Tax=Aspergillus karnatakaensis TaxID=1810916 RepID=UPI003CCD728A